MGKLSDDLTLITTKLMMTTDKGELLKITNELSDCIGRLIEQEHLTTPPSSRQTISSILKFTEKEISKMAPTFKKKFILNGLVAHCIKRKSGRNGFYYELRYRRDGYNISAASVNLQKAKQKFIEMTTPQEIEKYRCTRHTDNKINPSFQTIAEEWLICKQGEVGDKLIRNYKSYLDRYIYPEIGKEPLKLIRSSEISKIMEPAKEKPRLYEDLRTVFNSVFRYASANGLISYNPVQMIPFRRAERTPRRNLTSEEQHKFFVALENPYYKEVRQTLLIMYYFGLRPSEVDAELHAERNFLIARNRKRKNGKIEYKKIPIPEQAREKIDFTKPLYSNLSPSTINRYLKKIFDDKEITQYCLRHTFSTTCQMYVRQEIVNIWLGDAPDKLIGKHYTHFPDDFMISEMNKVRFEE